jgi:hypothetical protein
MRARYKVILPPGVSDDASIPAAVTPRGIGF